MSDPTLLQRLKERKLGQWAIAYLAGAWVLFEVSDAVGGRWSLPDILFQGLFVVLAFGFFITLILAWYHGEKGRQRVSGPELLMVTALLVVAGVAISTLGRGEEVSGPVEMAAPPAVQDDRPSIAVLPFDNNSPDPNDAYFADGMQEQLVLTLSKIRGLSVKGRTSAMRYRDEPKALPEIANELGVAFVIEGSARIAGGQVSVTVQLIDAVRDEHLWADEYDREFSPEELVSVHREIAEHVVSEVRAVLTLEDQARITANLTTSTEAYSEVLKGRFHWNQRTEEGMMKALEHFEKAIELDPGFAEAYAGIADSYFVLAGYNIVPNREACPEAKRAAERAIELDPEMATPLTLLGFLLPVCDYDWREGERQFRRALDLEPNHANAHHWYAWILSMEGRFEEALGRMERALELDPLSLTMHSAAGWILTASGSYDRAEAQLLGTLEMDEEYPRALMWLGVTYSLIGRGDEAILYARKCVDVTGRHPQYLAGLAFILGNAGRRDEARALFEEMEARSHDEFVAPYDFALALVGLAEHEAALDKLEEGFQERDFWVAFMATDPRFIALRQHPRFLALLRAIGVDDPGN